MKIVRIIGIVFINFALVLLVVMNLSSDKDHDLMLPEISKESAEKDFVEVKTLNLGQGNYNALAIADSESFWLADGRSVKLLNRDAKIVSEIRIPVEIFAITVLSDFQLFAAGKNDVFKLSKAGDTWSVEKFASFEQRSYITSLACYDQQLFVADAGSKKVVSFNTVTAKRIRTYSGNPNFVIPSPYFPIAISPIGELWIVNPGKHQIENYDANADRYLAVWKPFDVNFVGCCNPSLICALSGGRFVTMEKGSLRVCLFSPSGQLLAKVADSHDFSPGSFDYALAVDEKEQILILDDLRDQLRFFKSVEVSDNEQ